METTTQKQLTAEDILSFFLNTDDALDTAIKCGTAEYVTTDAELHDALACLKDYDTFNMRLLVKFLEHVSIQQGNKALLSEERVEQLRNSALSRGGTP